MRILFLSRWFPYPPSNGSKLRIYNLLHGLASIHEVHLLSFSNQPDIDRKSPEIQSVRHEVHVVPWRDYEPNSSLAVLSFFRLTPRSFVDTYSSEMVQSIKEMLDKNSYDLVIASQIDTARYQRHLRGLPAIFEEVEVGVLYERFTNAKSIKQRVRNRFTWEKHKHYLKSVLNDFQIGTVVSIQEKNLLNNFVSDKLNIDVIPNGVRLNEYSHFQPSPQPDTLIFTGSFNYYPNYEAMLWFIERVLPLIRSECPNVNLLITGDAAGYQLPNSNNVIQTGHVADVRPYIANSWASVVPILQGGGTRLKILEAMALHCPVVSTSKGAEGLDVRPGRETLIADTAESFAEAVINILSNFELRQDISGHAYRFVEKQHDWAVIMPRFLDLVDGVGQKRILSS